MAELRTIQEHELRDFPDRGDLLQLDDQYSVIPYPFESLGLEIAGKDAYILVIGPSGVFLISYHIILYESSEHFLTLVFNMEQTAEKLYHYLVRYCAFLPEIELLMVVNDGGLHGPASQRVAFTPWRKLKETIDTAPVCLDREKTELILDILNAKPRYQRIHKYQILCVLKRDPQQVKYLALDLVENRQVFIKEVDMPLDLSHMQRHAIVRGAKLSQELNHENIIQVERIFPVDKKIYIVTEWHEGGITLRQYLDNHPKGIPLSMTMELMKDLCHALMAAHDQGVVHRNLSPDSLLVTPDHRLKVFNFDLAKKSGLNTLQSTDLKQLSEENPYSPPEYIIGTHDVDQRVDVYALGVIFYELLTGTRPTHYDEQYLIPPSDSVHGLPSYIDTLISKTLKFSKEQRFSTVHAFYEALDVGVSDLIDSRYQLNDEVEVTRTEMSLIYQAKDLRSQKWVALKKLIFKPPEDLPIPPRWQRLEMLEAQLEPVKLLTEMEHPGLVRVLDTLIESDDAYIVMDWIEGRTLRDELNRYSKSEAMPEEYVLDIGLQMAEVLAFIHEVGYVHGDIKPENIMLTDERKVVLLDFIPRTLEDTSFPQTPRYMSPENLHAQTGPTVQGDIFALGTVLYELLSHNFPYELTELQKHFQTGRFPTPVTLDQRNMVVREELSQAIMQAIAYFPQERFLTVNELKAKLSGVTLQVETMVPIDPKPLQMGPDKMLKALFALTMILALIYFSKSWYAENKVYQVQEIFYE